MGKRELVRQINQAFSRAGMKDSWIHESFRDLYELGQLEHFQIFDINWFRGAHDILELVDELHTAMTKKEDFLIVAEAMCFSSSELAGKNKLEIAEMVKRDPSWRVRFFDLESYKREETRRKELEPLFAYLQQCGYHSRDLPRQIRFRVWTMEAEKDGMTSLLYLNENDRDNSVLIQTDKLQYVGVFESSENVLMQQL